MNSKKFNELVESRMDTCSNILVKKEEEYATGNDPLHNFKKGASIKGKTAVEVMDIIWLKHRVSIEDEMNKMAADPDYVPPQEWVEEKLTDNINYTILLEGLIADRRSIVQPVVLDKSVAGVITEHLTPGPIIRIDLAAQVVPYSEEFKCCPECHYAYGLHAPNCSDYRKGGHVDETA